MYFGHMDLYCKSDVVREDSDDEILEWLVDHAELRDEDFEYIGYFNRRGQLFTDLGKVSDISDRDYYDAIIK